MTNITTKEDFLEKFSQIIENEGLNVYSFVNEFLYSYVKHIQENYDGDAIEFFEDLQRGGCASGMIDEYIWYSQTEACYTCYANDMEEYREDLEDELGTPIKSPKGSHRASWMV